MRRPLAILAVAALAGCDLFIPRGSLSGPDAGEPADAGDAPDAGTEPTPTTLTFDLVQSPAPLPHHGVVADASGSLFSLNYSVLQRSADFGRTWTTLPNPPGYVLRGDGHGWLYAFAPGVAARSNDGGLTFTTFAVPALNSPASYVPGAATTSDGALWIYSAGEPVQFFRSTDHGDTFTQLFPPQDLTNVRICPSNDGKLHLNANTVSWRTDGTTWDDLGFHGFVPCTFGTAAGTILMPAFEGGVQKERRSTDGGATWTEAPAPNSPSYAQTADGLLVRLPGDGRLEESTDDGETWTARVTTSAAASAFNLPTTLAGYVFADTVRGLAILAPGATEWSYEQPVGLPIGASGHFVDVAFGGTRIVAVTRAMPRARLYVSDDGVSWAPGREFDTTEPITAVAMRPDGEQIFVGSTLGRYWLLDRNGDAVVEEDRLELSADRIQQAQWFGEGPHTMLAVTTANDQDTSGGLFQVPVDAEGTHTWQQLRPTQPGTYGCHGFALTKAGTTGIAGYAGCRRWYGTNAWQDHLRYTWEYGSGNDWSDLPLVPVSYGTPRSISAVSTYLQAVAFLYSENRLFVGALYPEAVELPAGLPEAFAAKFAPDGKLWLATDGGLYRSRESLLPR